jgi:hypothetical protein
MDTNNSGGEDRMPQACAQRVFAALQDVQRSEDVAICLAQSARTLLVAMGDVGLSSPVRFV